MQRHCPACDVAFRWNSVEYKPPWPCFCMCVFCAAVYAVDAKDKLPRALRRADLPTLKARFPNTPKHIQHHHDRITEKMWG